ncbi:Aste57867_17294 [Aphanomyces stellatus]|uniref:Aste57867_17294 protein n=1 Tax=Aphanomyces stellatus TaxID=120398 RepID=A0A485KFK5_9STRA|nr:hypothetical protein As57867_017235 [Aphanomyces stellatus]KAF0713640.1 hypothetical protein As57867_004251 [Aphanomyces stellatus]VFT81377.1 Aste57867_4262 [Aphanomyces stellatus]VFT94050.1 Aste57867_17294 [Aphanomyces stellatus]
MQLTLRLTRRGKRNTSHHGASGIIMLLRAFLVEIHPGMLAPVVTTHANSLQDELDDKTTPMLYRPPASVVPVEGRNLVDRSASRNLSTPLNTAGSFSPSSLMPTPPSFFTRLDQYIHSNDLRAWDVFAAMDMNNNKRITLEELLDGLHQINFDVSSTEQTDLVEWMHDTVEADGLSFKEFALALKLRSSSSSSPPRAKQQNAGKNH